MAGLKLKRLSLRERLSNFHIKLSGYRSNAGPGIVELTVAEAYELSVLLTEFDGILENLMKAQDLRKIRAKKRKKK